MASFLIADEDRNFREALAIALRLDGHDAATAGSAEGARARLAAGEIDCCLVDAHLQDADGVLEAAARAGIRTFATSPHADLVAAVVARHPRASGLPKPIRASELEACVSGEARDRRAG